jgi:hypothetical protein
LAQFVILFWLLVGTLLVSGLILLLSAAILLDALLFSLLLSILFLPVSILLCALLLLLCALRFLLLWGLLSSISFLLLRISLPFPALILLLISILLCALFSALVSLLVLFWLLLGGLSIPLLLRFIFILLVWLLGVGQSAGTENEQQNRSTAKFDWFHDLASPSCRPSRGEVSKS